MASKTLEILLRLRDQFSQELRGGATRAVTEHTRSLEGLVQQQRAVDRVQRESARSMAALDARRRQLVQDLRQGRAPGSPGSGVAGQIQTAERERDRLRRQAEQAADYAHFAREAQLRQQVENVEGRLYRLRRQQTEEAQRQRAATAELRTIERERAQVLERQRQTQAAQERLARQTATTERELTRLKRQQARDAELTAAAQRRAAVTGNARAIGGAFAGGAAAAGFNPLIGLGVGGLVGSGAGAGVIAAAGGAAAAGAGLVAATRATVDFEHAMSRVRALTGATGAEFDALEEKAIELGARTVFTARQAAEAMQQFALAGFDANRILAASGPALDLAAAGQLSMADASQIVVRIMAGMGIQARDTGAAVDVLVKAFTTANTDLRELGDAMKFVGPIARITGQELHQTAAAVQILSDAGMAGELAGTSLRTVLLSLANPSGPAADAMKELGFNVQTARDEMEKLGISVRDTQGNFLPLADIVEQFEQSLAGMGSADRLEYIGKIFPNRAASAFATLLQTGSARLREREAALAPAQSAGAADRVAEIQLDNTRGSFTRLTSAAESAGINIGQKFNPVLRGVADAATIAVQGVDEVVNALERLVTDTPDGRPIMDAATAPLRAVGWVIEQNKAEAEAREKYAELEAQNLDKQWQWIQMQDQQRRDRAGARLRMAQTGESFEDALANVRAQRNADQTARAAAQQNLNDLLGTPSFTDATAKAIEDAKPEIQRLQVLQAALDEVRGKEAERTAELGRQNATADQRNRLEQQLRDLADQRLSIEAAITAEQVRQRDERTRAADAARNALTGAQRFLLDQNRGDAARRQAAGLGVADQVTGQIQSLQRAASDPNTSAAMRVQLQQIAGELTRRLPELQRLAEEDVRLQQESRREDLRQERGNFLDDVRMAALRDRAALGQVGDGELQREEIRRDFERRDQELRRFVRTEDDRQRELDRAINDPNTSDEDRDQAIRDRQESEEAERQAISRQAELDQLKAERLAAVVGSAGSVAGFGASTAAQQFIPANPGAGAAGAAANATQSAQSTAKNTAEMAKTMGMLYELVKQNNGNLGGLAIYNGR